MIKKFIKSISHLLGVELSKYTPPNYIWLKRRNISVVLDIGANTGQFAHSIDKILPNVKIYSFEPIKSCYNELVKNSSNLNIKTFNLGVGEKEYSAEINISKHSPSSSLLDMENLHKEVFQGTEFNHKETIQVVPLDKLKDELNLEGKNYMIKIDVQGFEDKVIEGAKEIIKNASVIQIEMSYLPLYKNQKLFGDIFKMLDNLGFVFAGNKHQAINPADGSILYSDSIFLNKNDSFQTN